MIVVDMTPALAQHLLDTIEDCMYRPPNMLIVARFTRIMRSDGWLLTCSTIDVDPYGMLRNGRMRLMAVVRANITVQMTMRLVS